MEAQTVLGNHVAQFRRSNDLVSVLNWMNVLTKFEFYEYAN